jgi:TolA-binding protein
MYSRMFTIFVIFCFAVSGCAVLKNVDGNPEQKEMIKLKMSKDALEDDVTRLKQDNEAYRRVINEKQNEIDQLNKQIAQLNKELETTKMEGQQAKDLKQKEAAKTGIVERSLVDRVSPMEETQVVVDEKKAEATRSKQESSVPDGKVIDHKTLKVKVLSGNGNILSAKQMSKRLIKMGYMVKNTGMASRSDFAANTVYFASNYQKEAKQMAVRLGGKTIYKPMTWSSEFHIIVVTGR